MPPAPVAATAPATEFSAERALGHVREIAQRPHPAGSADNARVREYLLAQLRTLGLDPQVQEATGVGTRYPEAGRVRNVLARLPGRVPGGAAVVLMAHYDGVAGGPAAGDDAAGTAAVLETIRALRAGPPLTHDVIIAITDGEEAGLLGAAAFVREHPWAKDVGVTLNFEARGTRGRSYMFETGPGNLDAVRVLRSVRDLSATSLSVTVYRTLPNDTDLSEMAVLGKPALNFAFADGVERYHTAHDDVAHLDPGSVQHHGTQMLTLARAFGDGPLPRPTTGDAVFFDFPFVGLVVYPETWALPITIAAVVLVVAAWLRLRRRGGSWGRDVALGALGTVVATAGAACVAIVVGNLIARAHLSMGWGGAPEFRGVYGSALVMFALAVALACWSLVRRWASTDGAHVGALVVWALITVVVTVRLPGVSFMLAWPLIVGAVAALVSGPTERVGGAGLTSPTAKATATLWVATAVATSVIVPIVYAVSAVMLGIVGPGGMAAGTLTALLAWLLAPQLEAIGGGRRWITTGVAFAAAVLLLAVGMATVRSSPEHPTPSQIVYALDADSSDAWLAARGPNASQLNVLKGSGAAPPAWLSRAFGSGRSVRYGLAPRVLTESPVATVLADSTIANERRVVLRIRPPSGTETISLRANETRVLRAAIDGRPIDTGRYRGGVRSWRLDYTAPPDTGITLALTVPAGSAVSLDVLARSPGVPPLAGTKPAARPADVVTVQGGDVTVVHRTLYIP
jgi:hypothetical protein